MAVTLQATDERRVFDRFMARYPAKVKDSREDFGANMQLREASAEGARLASKDQFFVNDSVSLEVQLPDGKHPINIKGQVVWAKQNDTQDWEVGLHFHKVSFMGMSRLFRLATETA